MSKFSIKKYKDIRDSFTPCYKDLGDNKDFLSRYTSPWQYNPVGHAKYCYKLIWGMLYFKKVFLDSGIYRTKAYKILRNKY